MEQATFRTLAEARYGQSSLAGPGVLVTGKGYPDLITRVFLSSLNSLRPNISMNILTDYDPDGLNILGCYKYGSKSLDHETKTTVTGARWLGIRSDQVIQLLHENHKFNSMKADTFGTTARVLQRSATEPLAEPENFSPSQVSQQSAGSQPEASTRRASLTTLLTTRDRRVAFKSLARLECLEDKGGPGELRRELQMMLILNYKAEIQAVDNMGDITDWLDRHLLIEK